MIWCNVERCIYQKDGECSLEDITVTDEICMSIEEEKEAEK